MSWEARHDRTAGAMERGKEDCAGSGQLGTTLTEPAAAMPRDLERPN